MLVELTLSKVNKESKWNQFEWAPPFIVLIVELTPLGVCYIYTFTPGVFHPWVEFAPVSGQTYLSK